MSELPEGMHPAFDLAFAHALVRRCADGSGEPALRLHRPVVPMVVFGRRDTRLPGYPSAVRAAVEEGFSPAIRAVGGRPVAYTSNAVIVDEVAREPSALDRQERRFVEFGHRFESLLLDLGVDARIGAVPGEYCPGAYSINARGTAKLVGTAQRVLRDAWLFSSLLMVGEVDKVRRVLTRVYDALDLPFDPESLGSLSKENPMLTPEVVEGAVRSRWGAGRVVTPGPEVLRLAAALLRDHVVPAPDAGFH